MKNSTATPAVNYATDGLREAIQSIFSLISKSEKAQQKLAPATWQHRMLGDNLKALHTASSLMNQDNDDKGEFARDDLQENLRALALMIGKTEKSQTKFSPGTSQHTLQQSRLKALRIAQALIQKELDKR